jgi:hypothetical protein
MNKEQRDWLRSEIDKAARIRVENGYMDCDPESLTKRALEFDDIGRPDLGDALRRFRDLVVNQLMAEGWSIAKIEETAERVWRKDKDDLRGR